MVRVPPQYGNPVVFHYSELGRVHVAHKVEDHLEHVRFDGFVHRRGVHEHQGGALCV